MPSARGWKQQSGLGLTLVAAGCAAEWLRDPGTVWAVLCGVVALAALAVAAGNRLHWAAPRALVLLVLAGLLAEGQYRYDQVRRDWPRERERRVGAVFRRMSGELQSALRRVDRLSAEAARWATGDQARAFEALGRALPRGTPETAVAILEPTGIPWAWAGRHRLAPELMGDSLAARFSRFYAVLESRRHAAGGRVVVATLLVWADSAVPRADRSLAASMGSAAGVQLRVFPPGAAPQAPDIFDYSEPTTAGDRLLFSVQPIPPDQEVTRALVRRTASRQVAVALLGLLGLSLLGASTAAQRFTILGALLWVAMRAPAGAAVGFDDLFSPATFFRHSLGVFSMSAGHLLLSGALLLVAGIWLGDRRLRWPRLRTGVAVVLLLGTPYLIADLGRGITPPVRGVSTSLWLSWQLTLAIATSALIVLAGALLRSGEERRGSAMGVAFAAVIAVAAAVVGLVVWSPQTGWPEWYTFLWAPALLLAARPAPRWAAVPGIAIVAGTAAALVTWGAELNGRIVAAQRDLARLGAVEDPLAGPLLERLADQVDRGAPPRSAAELFLAWRGSDLAGQEFPARLALWRPDGSRRVELSLDSLDLPTPLLAALVKSFEPDRGREVIALQRVPGVHSVLLLHLTDGEILTAAVGPRTRLLVPSRLARLLRPPGEGAPLYELSISPPFITGLVEDPAARWSREGSEARTNRLFDLPGGSRQVHAEVRLRPLPLLLVRGGLLVAVNLLVLAVLWGLATLRLEPQRQWRQLRRLSRSFQVRLALALALFFVVPAVGFTAWGLGRLEDEADRTRDLLITSVLRDAALTAGGLLQEPLDYLGEALQDLSNRLDADLVLYSGGRLAAASAPILEDLSLVEPLVDARVFQRLALGDELEVTRQATTYVAPVRVGYRVAESGPPGGIGILATPRLVADWVRSQDQRDLAFILILATLAGLGAALLGAQLAARALSRPVADLRRSAAAVGQGALPPPVPTPPVEFEQVFGAFDRMAADIRSSQTALEEARQRTAAVLANVATGVVALDAGGNVLLANPRARQLLAAPLGDGQPLQLEPVWTPLLEAAERFLAGARPDAGAEFEVDGRSFRLQLARLGKPQGGVVLAVDDVSNLTQAARVLAWGEMARQIAHEIKNPLTPIRLGVQHLSRVRRDRPEQFDQVLADTSARILAEIDRLDTIARAFSRFGLPGTDQVPLQPVDVAALVREASELYRLAPDGVRVAVRAAPDTRVPARPDEVKEVIGNLLENARNAGAREVEVVVGAGMLKVRDNGRGIPPELLPRIFEPRFSTTTSGSGLGLPIVRRLVEGWGARVEVQSTLGEGTEVTIQWFS